MKVFKSLVTLLLALAMVCECGVNALAAGVGSPVSAPTHTHTGGYRHLYGAGDLRPVP